MPSSGIPRDLCVLSVGAWLCWGPLEQLSAPCNSRALLRTQGVPAAMGSQELQPLSEWPSSPGDLSCGQLLGSHWLAAVGLGDPLRFLYTRSEGSVCHLLSSPLGRMALETGMRWADH